LHEFGGSSAASTWVKPDKRSSSSASGWKGGFLQRRHKNNENEGVEYGDCSMFGSRVVTGGGLSWVKDDGTLEKSHAMETPKVNCSNSEVCVPGCL